jgi:pilus assembly protein CpaC
LKPIISARVTPGSPQSAQTKASGGPTAPAPRLIAPGGSQQLKAIAPASGPAVVAVDGPGEPARQAPHRLTSYVSQEPAPPLPALGPAALPELPGEKSGADFLQEIAISSSRTLRVFLNHASYMRTKPGREIVRVAVANPSIADAVLLDLDTGVGGGEDGRAAQVGLPSALRPDLREVRGRGHLLAIVGLGFGATQITVWDDQEEAQTFHVSVTIDEKDLEKRLQQALAGCHVTVRQLAQQIILEGQVRDNQMMAQVLQLVQSELRLSGQASIGSLANSVNAGNQQQIQGGAGGGGQTAVYSGGMGQNSLSVANQTNAQPGLIIVNRMRLPGPRQVMLKVKIAELNRSAIREFGVNFSYLGTDATILSAIGGISSAAGGSLGVDQQLLGVFDSGRLNLFINALRQNDLVKILAEPTLVTLDGQPASFQAGGSFPYPVPQAGNQGTAITINFAPFGAILEFLPTILPGDQIQLQVFPQFSELNRATGVSVLGTSVPGLNIRSAQTVVALREGQTLAIAGLLQTRTEGTTTRIPLIGDIPVIGQGFSRNRFTTSETELIVLVTPELVEAVDPTQVPPSPGDLVLEPNDAEFYLLGRLEGKTGHPHRSTISYLDPLNIMRNARSQGRWVVGPSGHSD